MVDIGAKKDTRRVAIASATVYLGSKAFKYLMDGNTPKGDVFETARVAGILAAKLTPTIIPHCHPLHLDKVTIRYKTDKKKGAVHIEGEVACRGKTGVEMEALTAVSVSALTMYDMLKFVEKKIAISEIELLYKKGGKSGVYHA